MEAMLCMWIDQTLQFYECASQSWYSIYEFCKLQSGARKGLHIYIYVQTINVPFSSAQTTNSSSLPQNEAALATIGFVHLYVRPREMHANIEFSSRFISHNWGPSVSRNTERMSIPLTTPIMQREPYPHR